MKYELAVFDLDGTILDTLRDLAESTNYALRSSKLPERTIGEVRKFVGNGIRLLIERAVPENTPLNVIDTVFEDFKKHYGEHCTDYTSPYEGVTELISVLREKGIKTAVVSNKADFAVQELCKRYFPGLFDFTVGEREGIRRKPAPDSVNEVLEALGANRKRAVYIGDSDVDVATARNSGLDCIAVTWGFRDREALTAAGAVTFADTADEVMKLITNNQ